MQGGEGFLFMARLAALEDFVVFFCVARCSVFSLQHGYVCCYLQLPSVLQPGSVVCTFSNFVLGSSRILYGKLSGLLQINDQGWSFMSSPMWQSSVKMCNTLHGAHGSFCPKRSTLPLGYVTIEIDASPLNIDNQTTKEIIRQTLGKFVVVDDSQI
eukprot:Gb_14906 [translate_table: standard]